MRKYACWQHIKNKANKKIKESAKFKDKTAQQENGGMHMDLWEKKTRIKKNYFSGQKYHISHVTRHKYKTKNKLICIALE